MILFFSSPKHITLNNIICWWYSCLALLLDLVVSVTPSSMTFVFFVCGGVCGLIRNRQTNRGSWSVIRVNKQEHRECLWEDKMAFDWKKVVETSSSETSIWLKVEKNINNLSTFFCINSLGNEEEAYKTTNVEMNCYIFVSYIKQSGDGEGWTVKAEMWPPYLKSWGVWDEEAGWDSNTNIQFAQFETVQEFYISFLGILLSKHLHKQH